MSGGLTPSQENLLEIAAGAILTLLEGKYEACAQRLVQAYRAGENYEGKAAELAVYTDLITTFKQKLKQQQGNKGVPT